MVVSPSDNFQYYSDDAIYWNNFKEVADFMSCSVSGRPDMGWIGHVKNRYGSKRKGLFMNCGNGWVERDCFSMGLIREAIGIDIMQNHISHAQSEAAKIGMPAVYIAADINTFDFSHLDFDLVVNVGAMHHVAYIDRVVRGFSRALKPNGIYVIGNDYTGPHRNQYAWEAWAEVVVANSKLPKEYQQKLIYPNLTTMLAFDPSEAVHSELEMEITLRYFDILEEVRFGGAIAYVLLYNNRRLYNDRFTERGQATIQRILQLDKQFLQTRPNSNLFTYAVGRPKATAEPEATLAQWSMEESVREAAAERNGGRYYPPSALELIYNEFG